MFIVSSKNPRLTYSETDKEEKSVCGCIRTVVLECSALPLDHRPVPLKKILEGENNIVTIRSQIANTKGSPASNNGQAISQVG